MSELTMKGAIKLINPINVISDKFSVREFVITTLDEKYPQDVIFQTVNDKMDTIAPYGQGQVVTVSFNVRGREYNGKWYNTLDAYKVQGEAAAPSQQPIEETDDLPF
jgi:single-strand DNA-binding protein